MDPLKKYINPIINTCLKFLVLTSYWSAGKSERSQLETGLKKWLS
jgi:hypothetical protein